MKFGKWMSTVAQNSHKCGGCMTVNGEGGCFYTNAPPRELTYDEKVKQSNEEKEFCDKMIVALKEIEND